ncbi:MAG: ribonuclease H family protein [Blautia sp.]|nr:ribonuclease H family protein [Blautia sp.]
MAVKKNFYAVRKGRNPGIYKTWKECQQQVTGFSGAEFRGFVTLPEAEEFMQGPGGKEAEEGRVDKGGEGDVIAYVDGSYDHSLRAYAYGAVLVTADDVVELSGKGKDEQAAALRNVAGEMLGAMQSVKWCLAHGFTSLEIHYDYEGIEKWVNGAWKAGNVYTQGYAAYMQKAKKNLAISFWKVKAHTGVELNERADRLAKAALREGKDS